MREACDLAEVEDGDVLERGVAPLDGILRFPAATRNVVCAHHIETSCLAAPLAHDYAYSMLHVSTCVLAFRSPGSG